MRQRILSLNEGAELSAVGGKAYALGKLVRAGFNVPPGFTIAADNFMQMTPVLESHILSSFDELQAKFVAVRSSAIGEDGKDAAWAGQLDTFLNCTRGNLIEKIEACWSSANSARAQSYAQQKSLQNTKVAVVVQAMIPSEISGVAFSVHPVLQNSNQVVIEAGLGLGEAIVSGEITPDTYIVNKASGLATEKHVSQQEKKLVRSNDGKTIWQDIKTSTDVQKLSDKHIKELCELTVKLESFFNHPVDVEWAVHDDLLYVLQSRPITTLQ